MAQLMPALPEPDPRTKKTDANAALPKMKLPAPINCDKNVNTHSARSMRCFLQSVAIFPLSTFAWGTFVYVSFTNSPLSRIRSISGHLRCRLSSAHNQGFPLTPSKRAIAHALIRRRYFNLRWDPPRFAKNGAPCPVDNYDRDHQQRASTHRQAERKHNVIPQGNRLRTKAARVERSRWERPGFDMTSSLRRRNAKTLQRPSGP
jgi:hypothetical protein